MDDEQQTSGWTVFRLPRSHWHCHLFNFDWACVTPAALRNHINSFVQEVADGKAPHALLVGKPGIGKSHIGVGVYRALTAVYGTGLVCWINVPTFCETVKRSYGAGEVDPWPDIEDAKRLLVLDDLFARELSAHEKDQIITRLLDTAYQNNAAILCTMHQDVQELQMRLPPHEVSRLLANNAPIFQMTSQKDYRRG